MQLTGKQKKNQKRTFLPYERSILPEDLRLGNLYINPLDPTDGLDTTRFEYREDLGQEAYELHVRQWTRKEENDVPFSVRFERAQAASANISFSEWATVGTKRDKATHACLQGASGRRVKIKKQEAFLQDVFKQPYLDQWVRRHASVTHRIKHGHPNGKWDAPELWLVTGVQYVTGGSFTIEDDSSNEVSGQVGVDLSALAGGPPGAFKMKASGSRERSNGAQNDFGHEDERVWAAQFMPVKIIFGKIVDPELSDQTKIYPKTIHQFRLLDVPDLALQGLRAGNELEEEASSPPLELIGNIISETREDEEGESGGDEEGLIIDDRSYVNAIRHANWELYEEGLRYLREREQRKSRRRG
ncbi:hypothetical protein P280DRAFT_506088 [Massarina eburnea CBS 473.64]|uniref:Uncharacterized protein n=1 Tax=Massarina eburnea CBS 473.64 TaxID=1395130 RepID=A0A6A6S4T4_9PLEO|nr:hypothetical protein P280DRAFT_506088 [Massarina eburnea CBS 473.64]